MTSFGMSNIQPQNQTSRVIQPTRSAQEVRR